MLRAPGHRRVVLVGWALAALAITNPGAGYDGTTGGGSVGGGRPLDAVERGALGAVAGGAKQAAALAKKLPPGALRVSDLGLFSVVTVSSRGGGSKGSDQRPHSWRAPAVAVGAGGDWVGLVKISSGPGGGLSLKGRPVPAWALPAALLAAACAIVQLSV